MLAPEVRQQIDLMISQSRFEISSFNSQLHTLTTTQSDFGHDNALIIKLLKTLIARSEVTEQLCVSLLAYDARDKHG